MSFRSILVTILLFSVLKCSALKLSDKAEIRVITFSPTQIELYTAFGHSGFRVVDPINRIDDFYNYGVFDFDQPNFYLNFTRGKLLYKLEKFKYNRIFYHYHTYENRSVSEQILNLDQEEKQKVFDFLTENNKPENREYYYNYIYDNCATKMRDVLKASLDGEIVFDYSYVKEELSYRDLMDLYLKYQPWGDLGIDICLGSEIDEIADGNGYLYLPDYIEIAFNKAKISKNGVEKPLVLRTEKLNAKNPESNKNGFWSPMMVFVFVFFVIGLVTHRGLKYNTRNIWLDSLLFGTTGIVGFLLLLLWFATDHLSAYNWNLLWAMPLNVVALYYLVKKRNQTFVKFYFLVFGIIQLCFIAFRDILPQSLHLALVPFALGLALRSFYLFYRMKQSQSH